MTMRTAIWIGLVLAGCGGGADTPAEKCEALVDVMCDRFVECLDGADGMHRECVTAFRELFPCATAKDVSSSYDACLDDLESRSCQLLTPRDPDTGEQSPVLPDACASVILLSSAPPQDSASTLRTVAAQLRR